MTNNVGGRRGKGFREEGLKRGRVGVRDRGVRRRVERIRSLLLYYMQDPRHTPDKGGPNRRSLTPIALLRTKAET